MGQRKCKPQPVSPRQKPRIGVDVHASWFPLFLAILDIKGGNVEPLLLPSAIEYINRPYTAVSHLRVYQHHTIISIICTSMDE